MHPEMHVLKNIEVDAIVLNESVDHLSTTLVKLDPERSNVNVPEAYALALDLASSIADFHASCEMLTITLILASRMTCGQSGLDVCG